MADEEADAQRQSPPSGRGPRRWGLLWIGLLSALVVALGVGVVVLALGDGDDDGDGDESKVSVAVASGATSSTSTNPAASPTTIGSNTGASTGASGGGTQPTNPQTTTTSTAPPATSLAPPDKKTTTPTLHRAPRFTSAVASPNVVQCETGTSVPVTISWTTVNATTVHVNSPSEHPPSGSITYNFGCPTSSRTGSFVLSAIGPGGRAETTVSYRFEVS